MAPPTGIPAGTHFPDSNAFLNRAYSLQSESEARALYDEWAASYDADLSSMDYMSPSASVAALASALASTEGSTGSDTALEILDAGCGTGLVGVALLTNSSLRARISRGDSGSTLDGVDLSPGMLAVARKTGAYRNLTPADLTQPLASADGAYDAVLCVGTLTQGHVGPKVFGEFARVLKARTGLLVATVLGDVWADGGYEAEVKRLEGAGAVDIVGVEDFGIRKGESRGGKMVVLRKR